MRATILILVALAACGPTLYSRSAPPPGRTAALDENDGRYDLAISQGVAIAIGCQHHGPCKGVVISTEDETIADVKGGSFSSRDEQTYTLHTMTPAGVVIIGKQPGKTRVKVKTAKGSKTIHVTVLPPPAIGQPATVARP